MIKMKDVMILTGAGQIGMAIARRMGYGMKVVIGDKRVENAEEVANILNKAGFDTFPMEMDLSDRQSILRLINTAQQYGEIAMLVNAAGYGKTGRFEEIPLEDQLGMIDLNCRSLTKMTGICLPHLHKGSRIVNIASAAAFSPQPGFAVYAAGKSYVYRLSMALREELKGKGILVTAVCPGPVETEFFQISGELPGKLKTAFRQGVSEVVRQALKDAAKGKPVSVYGKTMKAARICGKILPDPLLASLMKRTNQIR